MKDRFLRRLGEILIDPDSRKRLLSRVKIWVRRILTALTFSYLALLLLSAILLRCVGENNLTLAFGLYLPRIIFLAPLVALVPLVLLFHWRLSAPIIIGAVLFLSFCMEFKIGRAPDALQSHPEKTLTVMTYNRGQHMNQSLKPFKNATDPDIIAMQDSGGRAKGYATAEGYEKFTFTQGVGEFTLLSRHPILSSTPIKVSHGNPSNASAARFEIDFGGTRIALYSVHIISPRDTLKYYRRGAFLYGIIGVPGTSLGEKREANQTFWDDRVIQARELAQIIDDDMLPTIVVGDFNAPAGGYIHGLFLKKFNDAHLRAGRGFGFTFPGVTRNPLSLGGPWMRIDYLFSDTEWDTVWCITEPDRPSQHRAVTARFQLHAAP